MTSLSQTDITNILSAHNYVRSQYCLAGLAWDYNYATIAQTYANKCLQRHNPEATTVGLGENIYDGSLGGFGGATAERAVWSWADEERDWVCESGLSLGTTGHFIQIVRNTTTRIGCGSATCTFSQYPGYTFLHVVCNYYTGSNPAIEPFPKQYCAGICDTPHPTLSPTPSPSPQPTSSPTDSTVSPTLSPSPQPTSDSPTASPSPQPTLSPSPSPTLSPSPTPEPTSVIHSERYDKDKLRIATDAIALYMILCYLPLIIFSIYIYSCKPPSEIRDSRI